MARDEIAISLYKINLNDLPDSLEANENPSALEYADYLVTTYNESRISDKDISSEKAYNPIKSANGSRFATSKRLKFYKKDQATAVTHSWSQFFKKENIDLGNIQSATPNIVCFIEYEDELYAFTTGSASIVFERYIDQTFPIDLAKRVASPELKGGKQQSISGSVQASDIYFRRPTRIGLSNSHQEVWKNLSGNIESKVVESEDFIEIFGKRRSVSVEIKASIKISAPIDSPPLLLKLLKWIVQMVSTDLTDEQKDSFSFFDSIRPLNSRKDKNLIQKLNEEMATRFLSKEVEDLDLSLSHDKTSQYLNADRYLLRTDGTTIEEWASDMPEVATVSAVINSLGLAAESNKEILDQIRLHSKHDDFQYLDTNDPLFKHLNGELLYEKQTYYLLNGSWYNVKLSFQDLVEKDLIDILNKGSHIGLLYSDVGLQSYEGTGEPTYNLSHAGQADKIVGDKVFYKNLELADIMTFDGQYINVIHVKRELGAEVRELVSQMQNAIDTIENDLNITGNPALTHYYKALSRQNRVDNISKDEFIKNFKEKTRRYIFAYISDEELSPVMTKTMRSSIAKNEIVSIVQFSAQLRPGAELKLVHIPNRGE